LLSELILTRIYSVTLGYHFAFLAISIALFGIGASGILVYVKSEWFPPDRLTSQLCLSASAFGVALYLTALLLLNFPLTPTGFGALTAIYLASALPFFFAGLVLALLFTHRSRIITRLYFFDLLGAALGCLAVIAVLNLVGGPTGLFLCGLIAIVAAVLFGLSSHSEESRGSSARLAWIRRLGIAAAVLSALGVVASRFIRPVALPMGRRMFDQFVERFDAPHSYDWYVENYVGGELDLLTVFFTLIFTWSLIVSLGLAAVASRAGSQPGSLWARRPHMLVPAWLGLLMVGFIAVQMQTDGIRVRFARGRFEAPAIYEKWNAISRIKVFPHKDYARSRIFAWGLSTAYDGPDIEQLRMNIDSQSGMPVIRFAGDLDSPQAQHLKYDVSSLGYYLTDEPTALIIGPGGGRDILTSLVFDAHKVVAVELNPTIVDVVNNVLGDYTGRLYQREDVDLIVGEGRSFLRRSRDRFDLIQISLIDTWAAVARGALSMSENTLYTKEAFEDYLGHLTDDGVLSVTRFWHDPPVRLYRMLNMLSESLVALGEEPANNIIIVRGPARGQKNQGRSVNLIAKRTALTAEELSRIEDRVSALKFDLVYLSGREGHPDVTAFVRNEEGARARVAESVNADISPTSDDRPFFFYAGHWSRFFLIDDIPNGSATLARLLYVILALILVFIFAPLLLLRRADLAGIRSNGKRWFFFFGSLGIGFIMVEIVLIQRLILFLGHPIYATTVVLFGMLASAGLGSRFAGRFDARLPLGALTGILAFVLVILVAVELGLPAVMDAFLYAPLGARVALALATIAPLGFVMGMPFPLGVLTLAQTSPTAIPWMWGLNGATSVLGTVLAACLSMNFGYTLSYAVGSSCYLVAFGVACGSLVASPRLKKLAEVRASSSPAA
jgi:hypothetical protein